MHACKKRYRNNFHFRKTEIFSCKTYFSNMFYLQLLQKSFFLGVCITLSKHWTQLFNIYLIYNPDIIYSKFNNLSIQRSSSWHSACRYWLVCSSGAWFSSSLHGCQDGELLSGSPDLKPSRQNLKAHVTSTATSDTTRVTASTRTVNMREERFWTSTDRPP